MNKANIYNIIGYLSIGSVLYGTSIGINITTFPLFLDSFGLTAAEIGYVISTEMISTLLFAPFVTKIIKKHGIFKTIIGALMLRNIFLILFGFGDSKILWMSSIFIYGIGGFVLFLSLQLWVNKATTENNRATCFGILNASFALGISLGPRLLQHFSLNYNSEALIVSAVICSLLIIPVLLVRKHIPQIDSVSYINIPLLLERAKLPIMGGLVVDYVFYALGTYIVLYGISMGVDMSRASLLVSYMVISSVFLDIPIGMLIDRINRKIAIVLCATTAIICALLLPYVILNHLHSIILFAVWSGSVSGIYIASLSILGDTFKGNDLIAANAALGIMNSLGSYVGISATGISIDNLGDNGLVISLAGVCSVFLIMNILYWIKDKKLL